MNELQFALIHRMAADGKPQTAIAKTTGLSRAVVGRVLRDEIASLRRYSTALEDGELPLYGAPS